MCILSTNEFLNQRYPQHIPSHRTSHRQRPNPYNYSFNDSLTNTMYYSPAYSVTTSNGRISRRNYTTHQSTLSTAFWPIHQPVTHEAMNIPPRPVLIRHSHTPSNDTENNNITLRQLNQQTNQLQNTLRNTMTTLNNTANELRNNISNHNINLSSLNTRLQAINNEHHTINNINRSVNNTVPSDSIPALQSIEHNPSPEPSIPIHSRNSFAVLFNVVIVLRNVFCNWLVC